MFRLRSNIKLFTVLAVLVALIGATAFISSGPRDSLAYGPWMESERTRSSAGGRSPDWYCPNQSGVSGNDQCYFRVNWACRQQATNDEPAGELCMWSDCTDCAGCNHLDSDSDDHWDDCCSETCTTDEDGNETCSCNDGYCIWSSHEHGTGDLDYCAPCQSWRWRVEGRASYSTYRDQLGRLMTFDEYMEAVNAVDSAGHVDGINRSLFLHGVPHSAGAAVREHRRTGVDRVSPYYLAPSVQFGDLRNYLVEHFRPGTSEIQNTISPTLPADVWRAWGLQPHAGVEGGLPGFGSSGYVPVPRTGTGALYAPDSRDRQTYHAIPTPAWIHSWPTATPPPAGEVSEPLVAGSVDDPSDPRYNVRVTTSDFVTGIRVLASGGDLCNSYSRAMAIEWDWVDGAYFYEVEIWDVDTRSMVSTEQSFTNRAYVDYLRLSPCDGTNPVRYEVVVRGYDYTGIRADPTNPSASQDHSTGNLSRFEPGGPRGVAPIHTMPTSPVNQPCGEQNACFCPANPAPLPGTCP